MKNSVFSMFSTILDVPIFAILPYLNPIPGILYPRLPFRNFARETHAPFPGSLTCRDFDSPWGTRDQPRLPPEVSSLCVYLRVTRLAQRNKITPIVSATFTQRLLVVNLFSLHDNSSLKTQFTEGMFRGVLISDPLPCTAISALFFLMLTSCSIEVSVWHYPVRR